MYILYGGGVTRSVGPQMVLEEAGLDYELRTVDLARGEHRTPEFLKINPAGLVPALVTPEGVTLHESAAIMLHLADAHAPEVLAPLPSEPARAPFLAKLFYLSNDIQPPMKRYFYASRYALRPEDVAATQAKAREMAEERWRVLDDYLEANGPYHLGERFSIADIQVANWAVYGFETPDDVANAFPAVGRCLDRVMARPKCGPILEGIRTMIIAWNAQNR